MRQTANGKRQTANGKRQRVSGDARSRINFNAREPFHVCRFTI